MKQTIKGNIRISVTRDKTHIEIIDKTARIHFIDIELTPKQFSEMLHHSTDCNIVLRGIENVGKQYEYQKIEFPLPNAEYRDKNAAKKKLREILNAMGDNWTSDFFFGSQDSFFKKGKIQWAKCIIHRYVEFKK